MALTTSAGATIAIGPATTATDVSALAALSYVTIAKAENISEIGPQSQDVTFTPLDGSAVQHIKGATDNGATAFTVGRDPLDPGQLAVRAAAVGTNKLEYAFKITLADGADANDTDTTLYLRGPVMSGRLNIGGSNDVTKVAYSVGNNVFIEVPSVAVT